MNRFVLPHVGVGRNHEFLLDDGCRSADLDEGLLILGVFSGALRTDIANNRVQARANELGVVLVEDLLVDDGCVLDLLGVPRLDEEQLDREDELQDDAVEDRDTWPRVQGHQRKEHHVYQDVAGAE